MSQQAKSFQAGSNENNEPKIVEKEKSLLKSLMEDLLMLGFVALVGAYLTTGQIIPGFI